MFNGNRLAFIKEYRIRGEYEPANKPLGKPAE
jgi:hypothetical protein